MNLFKRIFGQPETITFTSTGTTKYEFGYEEPIHKYEVKDFNNNYYIEHIVVSIFGINYYSVINKAGFEVNPREVSVADYCYHTKEEAEQALKNYIETQKPTE